MNKYLSFKKRKKRTTSLDMCPYCGWANCDPIHSFLKTRYVIKTMYRKENELCIGCGHKECSCKTKRK